MAFTRMGVKLECTGSGMQKNEIIRHFKPKKYLIIIYEYLFLKYNYTFQKIQS